MRTPSGNDLEFDVPDRRFQSVSGLYAGLVLAGVTMAAVAAITPSPTVLAGSGTVAGIAGIILGVAVARVDRELPARLGRTLVRRIAILTPGFLGAIAVISPVPADGIVVAVSAGVAVGTFVVGYALGILAENRYVAAVAAGAPVETWAWTPPSAPLLDGILFFAWTGMAVAAAVVGDWANAAIWATIGGTWAIACVLEGRWRPVPAGARPEVRIYEHGLVKQRPYSRSFLPWDAVDHVRVREDELVVDRGLRDVRFDRAELDELETVRESIERRLETGRPGD